jgi:hypothetical protein
VGTTKAKARINQALPKTKQDLGFSEPGLTRINQDQSTSELKVAGQNNIITLGMSKVAEQYKVILKCPPRRDVWRWYRAKQHKKKKKSATGKKGSIKRSYPSSNKT